MHGFEATLGFADYAVEVRDYPIDCANNLVGVEDDASDDSDVHDTNARLPLTEKAFDGDAVAGSNLRCFLVLAPLLPAEHPHALADECFVLVVGAAP